MIQPATKATIFFGFMKPLMKHIEMKFVSNIVSFSDILLQFSETSAKWS